MRLIEWSWVSAARLRAGVEQHLRTTDARRPGQSTVEYALVGALVVIAAAGAMTLLGGEVTTVFSRITTTLSGAASSAH
ncbi:MAG TPA: hypothetical protein VGJ60_34455 [Chloroflexota bacterium]